MIKSFLLIDGYNLIFAWDKLSSIAKDNLEEARIKLMNIVSNYKGCTSDEIIIVFDAYKVKGNVGTVEIYNNIKIVYTKEAETADNYIERASTLLVGENIVKVVTSDYVEQIIIMSKGCQRISCSEFIIMVDQNNKSTREYINKRPSKNNMLINNLDEKTANILQQMIRGK